MCGCSQGDAVSPGDEDDIVLIGLEGSGKTLLAQRLRTIYARVERPFSTKTTETNGTVNYTIPTYKGCPFKHISIRESGGSMQEIWDNYLTSTHVKGVVFTLDLSNPATMAGGGLALCELLQHPALQSLPVCVALTKADLPCPLQPQQLDLALGLRDMQATHGPRLCFVTVSAAQDPVECPALLELLDWAVAAKARRLGLPVPRRKERPGSARRA